MFLFDDSPFPTRNVYTVFLIGNSTIPLEKGRPLSSRNERHVTPHPDGGWQVTRPGGDRAISRNDTQAEAIDRARELLHNDGGGELVIHRPDGTIRDSDTVAPGNDPFPPADRR